MTWRGLEVALGGCMAEGWRGYNMIDFWEGGGSRLGGRPNSTHVNPLFTQYNIAIHITHNTHNLFRIYAKLY